MILPCVSNTSSSLLCFLYVFLLNNIPLFFFLNLVGIENVNYWFKSCIGCDRGSICLSDCVVQAGF